ncbi:MAG: HEAT repeat domain-containing protein [Planctomycetes bacterium]|nr:HEAT repeat domain-containing protein [Planctomycetota bacterium]
MKELQFNKLTWRKFETLTASLLEAEGFVNVISAGGSGGDMGLDISADEIRRSISGRVSTFRWMVQAKHYAGQPGTKKTKIPKNVGHHEISDIITFLSEHDAQGLLLITDTNVTSSAAKKITSFHDDKRHPFEAHFWNQRILSDRIRKHSELLDRYFQPAKKAKGKTTYTENPFRFLEPFRRMDRQLFFGRDRQIRELTGLVCNSTILVLFGESGSGKTSLLNAGLIPELSDQHFLIVHCRCLDTPCDNIRREALRLLEKLAKPDELTNLGSTSNTAEFIRRLRILISQFEARMIIIVDQFEEAFTRAGIQQRNSLAEAVLSCSHLDTSPGSLTILFSIREDYMGSLWEWSHKNALSEVWGNTYRISRLNTHDAKDAIMKPFAFAGKTLRKILGDKLVADLERIGDNRVYPPYVQIICGTLFDEVGSAKEITLEIYDSIGKAEGIIGDYLDSKLFLGLTPNYAVMARSILDSLTGGEGLRTLLPINDIQAITGIEDKKQLKEIIDILIKRRIIVPQLDEEKLLGYELVHDFLSRRFFEKLKPAEKRERAIRDVFRRAFKDWKQHGILVSKSSLDEFYTHRKALQLNEEQSFMIIESAFASGKYKDWKDYINEKGFLLPAIIYILKTNKNASAVRISLKQVSIFQFSVDTSLIMSFLKRKEYRIRSLAIESLGLLGDKRAVGPLIDSLRTEKDRYVRMYIYYALGQLGDKRAVEPLIKCLATEEDDYIWRYIVKALGKLGDKRAVGPLRERLKKEKDYSTRNSIVESLRQLGVDVVN